MLEDKTETKDITDRLAKAMMTISWVILVLMMMIIFSGGKYLNTLTIKGLLRWIKA